MLIIAIPKSASTSLAYAIKDILNKNLVYIQINPNWNRKLPFGYKYIYNWHRDIREITKDDVDLVENINIIYKQHFPPTPNNLRMLDKTKKVILLRDTEDIMPAYYRAYMKKMPISFRDFNFNYTMSKSDFITTANRLGIVEDIENFYSGWKKYSGNALFITYNDVINNTLDVINEILDYYGEDKIVKQVFLPKLLYTGSN